MQKHLRQVTSLVVAVAMTMVAAVPGFAGNREGRVTTAAANVKHVFLIVLENKTFSNTFGTSTQDPYLQKTLVPAGAVPPRMRARTAAASVAVATRREPAEPGRRRGHAAASPRTSGASCHGTKATR